ncbi:winged helix-turn-helix transcriptional regulator [Micromonospora sp. NPDC047620]|uniref:winged helix-turn-helix transcriptional regulator n=1 Tax=Micromonospora sp. NPDC047620 TaxID=3364251 RepID=UPI00371875DE
MESAVHPNVYARNCGSRQVLDRIGDRWSVLVVLTLADGTKRYGELAQRIEGVSQKMLTQTLRALERDGLVTRTVHASVPPRVDYALTDLGRSLLDLVAGLESWATTHLDEVEATRARYDAEPH